MPSDETDANRIPLKRKNGLFVNADNIPEKISITNEIMQQQKDKILRRLGFKTTSFLYNLWISKSEAIIGAANPIKP
jgi:hypothetical protein